MDISLRLVVLNIPAFLGRSQVMDRATKLLILPPSHRHSCKRSYNWREMSESDSFSADWVISIAWGRARPTASSCHLRHMLWRTNLINLLYFGAKYLGLAGTPGCFVVHYKVATSAGEAILKQLFTDAPIQSWWSETKAEKSCDFSADRGSGQEDCFTSFSEFLEVTKVTK